MAYQLLSEIKLDKPTKKIKVRIARLWRAFNPRDPDKLISLDFIAIDAEQNPMHMYVRSFEAAMFENLLKEGSLYSISRFQVKKAKNSYNAIPGDLNICLTRASQIDEIYEKVDLYPRHYFVFTSFHQLRERVGQIICLTDVIGIMTSFTPAMKVTLHNMNKETEKRDVYIQNLWGEEVKVVLFGSLTTEINEKLLLEETTNPVFIFAGTLVKSYMGVTYLSSGPATKMYLDLEISETAQYKAHYKNQPINVQLLAQNDNPAQIIAEQRTKQVATILELLNVDPLKSQNTIYELMVKIIDVDPSNGWFYNACNECPKSLQYCAGKYWCIDHGAKTPNLIPKVHLIIEDDTAEMELIVFGKTIEKLAGETFTQLLSLSQMDKMILPGPISALRKQMKRMDVVLTSRATKTGIISYKMINCDDMKEDQSFAATLEDTTNVTT